MREAQCRNMSVRIIVTGGTFDKEYDALRGELTFRDTHLPEILERVRCTVPIEIEINQLIDSLEMRESNRRAVLEACQAAPEKRIIVTHGTDTMAETARLLGEAGLPKTIVLTGAMVPYAFSGSDAVFNLGCAITASGVLASGVYITMNGRVFRWDAVRKDTEHGIFVEAE